MEKKKTKTKKKSSKINWDRIIQLSAAAQYIQNQLNEELQTLSKKS